MKYNFIINYLAAMLRNRDHLPKLVSLSLISCFVSFSQPKTNFNIGVNSVDLLNIKNREFTIEKLNSLHNEALLLTTKNIKKAKVIFDFIRTQALKKNVDSLYINYTLSYAHKYRHHNSNKNLLVMELETLLLFKSIKMTDKNLADCHDVLSSLYIENFSLTDQEIKNSLHHAKERLKYPDTNHSKYKTIIYHYSYTANDSIFLYLEKVGAMKGLRNRSLLYYYRKKGDVKNELVYAKKINRPHELLVSYRNNKRYKEVDSLFVILKEEYKKKNNTVHLNYLELNMTHMFKDKGQWKLAEKNYLKILDFFLLLNSNYPIEEIFYNLNELYLNTNATEKRLQLKDRYLAYKINKLEERALNDNSYLKITNELLKVENQKNNFKRQTLTKKLEIEKQKTERNYLIMLSALITISLIYNYIRFRIKRETAKVLTKQKNVISNQKIELEKSNVNKQKLFGIIAHDLINPFNAILGYTNLLDEDYNNFTDIERKEFISTINTYANNNYELTRTLLDWAKLQQDKFVINKTNINCKEIVVNAIQPYQVLADKKSINVVIHIPEDITVEADQNMMQTVIGNLFVNAIKFTPQKGKIVLNLNKNNDGTVQIEIKDNGIGMTQKQLNHIFDISKVSTLKGTNNEKGHGLGLILCKELMELQNGTLQLYSAINKGSKAVVTI